MVQRYPEVLGDIVKETRVRAGLTIEAVAERVDITDRYLYRIENDGQKPSFDVLCRLIRVLSIPSDLIFYPEQTTCAPEIEEIVRMLYTCDERSLTIVKATLKAAVESQRMNNKNAEPTMIE